MGARLTDSAEYAHLWGTAEVRAIFDQDARRQAWIEILVALADAQAERRGWHYSSGRRLLSAGVY